jgi:hypothetical protein
MRPSAGLWQSVLVLFGESVRGFAGEPASRIFFTGEKIR